jgi:hypothetical protein
MRAKKKRGVEAVSYAFGFSFVSVPSAAITSSSTS